MPALPPPAMAILLGLSGFNICFNFDFDLPFSKEFVGGLNCVTDPVSKAVCADVCSHTHALCDGEDNSGSSDHLHTLFDQRLLTILHQKQTSPFTNITAKASVNMC